jgi:predicted metal-dependent phosphoesterase TrpH
MFLADFHVHSTYSDGCLELAEVVDLFCARGFGAIAVTDHLCGDDTLLGKTAKLLKRTLTPLTLPEYFERLRAEAARAWERYRMVVIPGLELTRNALSKYESAHILALGVEQALPVDVDAFEAAQAVREAGGLAVAAHPVWTRKWEPQTYELWERRGDLALAFDAWEVASGPFIFSEVAGTKLPKIASSDLHHPRQMRSWKTVLECERHPEAILHAIKTQAVSFRFFP